MSRYDPKRSKNVKKTPFLTIVVLMALFFGVPGAHYVMTHFKYEISPEVKVPDQDASDDFLTTESFLEEQPIADSAELKPPPLEIQVSADNSAQPSVQAPGLPDLLNSDDLLRQSLIKISPGLAQWLGTDQLLRKYVVIVNDFAQGFRISNHMSFIRHQQPFSVDQIDNNLTIAAKSYQRYNTFTQAIQVIDAKAAVALYQKFRPLALQVFAGFSYPKDITLEAIVQKAAAEVLAAPTFEGQISVIRPSVHYKYADPKLEALSPVQKQMIRMGSENTRIIQNKLREFLVELAKIDIK